MPDRKVVIRGAVFGYAEKAPYTRSGKSLLGVLELDETEAKVKCHECGDFRISVGSHLKSHSVTIREYRRRHGLNSRTALMAPGQIDRILGDRRPPPLSSEDRRAFIAKALAAPRPPKMTEELRNFRRKCTAQIPQIIRETAKELGRTPSWDDLRAAGLSDREMLRCFGTTNADKIMETCGLDPRHRARIRLYTKAILVELLRDARARLRRVPCTRDCSAPLLPSPATFRDYFGSWTAALDAAGFGLVARERERKLQSIPA